MKTNLFIKLGIAVLLLFAGMSYPLNAETVVDSPQKNYDVKMSLNSATVRSFSEAFTQQTGVLFSYEANIASKNLGKVSIDAENATLQSILDGVLTGNGFSYEIVGGNVVVTYKEPVKKIVTVKGTVYDSFGQPMIGAGVMVQGSTDGTVTDIDGKYSLQVSSDATLVFSYIGCKDVAEVVGNRGIIDVTLVDDTNLLEETVVVGYGTQSRKTLTTSIAKVGGDEIYNAPVATVGDALKGKVSGLRIASSNNVAGGEPRFLIRGGSSINMSNDPIVIVDGVTRTLSDINPNDIESIEVLKDAASAGIYGARASNGVILVTTKKGSAHQGAQITYDMQVGQLSPARNWDLMNSQEFITQVRLALSEYGTAGAGYLLGANAAGTGNTSPTSMFTTRYLNEGEEVPAGYQWMYDPLDPTKILTFSDTDYLGQWFSNNLWQKHYLGVNGGNENLKYAASVSYLSDDGILAMNSYDLITMHGNTSFKITKNLTASTTFDFSRSKKLDLIDDYFASVGRGILVSPTHRDFGPDGEYITGGTNKNQQIAGFYEDFYDRERAQHNFTGNFNLKWQILPCLSATAQYAVTDQNYRGSFYAYGTVGNSNNYISSTRSTTETRTETLRDSFNAYLSFDKKLGKAQNHKLSATAGVDYTHWRYWYVTANATGSESDKVPILDSGVNFTASNEDTRQALLSYFGRVGYDYDGRYIFAGTFRADGSSKFAKGNQWGFFPAGSFAWIISEEPYWNVNPSTMNLFKFRASYGQTGNNGIGLYDTYGAYSTGKTYNGLATTLPSTMMNSDLKWETTTQLDLGIDVSFFKDRIRFVADYYNKRTDNMIFDITLPDTGTFGSVSANVGSARFYGFELELHTANIQTRDFSWTTDITYSFNKNEVLSLPDEYKYTDLEGNDAWRLNDGYTMTESGYRFGGTAVGEPLGRIYGYKIDHIIQTQAQADAALYDSNGKGYRRSDDKNIAGRRDVGDYAMMNRPGSALLPDGREQINGEDMYLLGNVMPHSIGGINNTITFKNWTFSLYLDYALGHSIYNYMKSRVFQNTLGNCNSNLDKMVYDAWKYPGDPNAKYARFFSNDADFGNRNYSRASDFNVEKADYLCIRDVSISYDLPSKWLSKIKVQKLMIGISGNTLHYFTGVSGSVNPETGMATGSGASQYDYANNGSASGNFFPPARKLLLNLKITF